MKTKNFVHRFYINFAFFVGIIFGAVASVIFKILIFQSVIWLVIAIILFIFSWVYPRISCIILSFIAGVLVIFWRGSIYNFGNLKIEEKIGRIETVRLVLAEDPDKEEDGTLKIRARLKGASGEDLGLKIFTSIKTAEKIRRSDEILVKGKISKGFGDFSISIKRGKLLKVNYKTDMIRDIRDSFAAGVRNFIPSPEVDLGIGYLLGQKNSLPERLSKALTATALTHIVVASGYNLTVIAIAIQKIFKKISRKLTLFIAILMVMGFVLVVGFSPSMTRAGIVAIAGLIFWYFGRKSHAYFLLFFVAAITLIVDPSNLLNLGWQLSFASFFGVLILSPLLQNFFFKNPEKLNSIFSLFFETFSAQISTLPLIIFTFGSVSLVSIFANMLVLPFVPAAMLTTFLTGIFSAIPFIAKFFGVVAENILKYSIFIIQEFSKLKGAQLELNFGVFGMVVFYCILILAVIFMSLKTKNCKTLKE